jgi:hypothetical protein
MNDTKKLVWIDTDPAFGDEQGDCDGASSSSRTRR